MTEKIDQALLWLDFETTGLDLDNDIPLEVAWVLTDGQLRRLVSGTDIFDVDPQLVNDRILANDFVREMHNENGLLSALTSGTARPIKEVEADIVLALSDDRLAVDAQVLLAGSGVGRFDREIIRRHMPELHERLHYGEVDMSSVRRLIKALFPQPLWRALEIPRKEGVPAHRAVPDVEHQIMQAMRFAQIVEASVAPAVAWVPAFGQAIYGEGGE